jgi:hypothetical protein
MLAQRLGFFVGAMGEPDCSNQGNLVPISRLAIGADGIILSNDKPKLVLLGASGVSAFPTNNFTVFLLRHSNICGLPMILFQQAQS